MRPSDVIFEKVSLSFVLNAVSAETDADVGFLVDETMDDEVATVLASIDVMLLLVMMGTSNVVVLEAVVEEKKRFQL